MQRTFGYARVSTTGQNLDTQLEQLRAAGCDRIFQEKVSGATSRSQLDQPLATVRAGDTVLEARLNWLGRNAVEAPSAGLACAGRAPRGPRRRHRQRHASG